jgi:hypothetical protein
MEISRINLCDGGNVCSLKECLRMPLGQIDKHCNQNEVV